MSRFLPSKDSVKEVFANFGHAYYISEVLHKQLASHYVLMSFQDLTDVTKPRIEEKYKEALNLTLGPLVAKVKPHLPGELQARLDKSLDIRNFLAHRFWWERAYEILSEDGPERVIAELQEYQSVFNELDDEITAITNKRAKELGVTSDLVNEQIQKGIAGESAYNIPAQKPLGKSMVRIIQAYDVPGATLVFLTDDGQILQFCDVGLGWSTFSEVGTNWIPNPVLSEYLPASVVPRPNVAEPWNYEFYLPKNRVLWVKKGKKEKTFIWGVKTMPKKKR